MKTIKCAQISIYVLLAVFLIIVAPTFALAGDPPVAPDPPPPNPWSPPLMPLPEGLIHKTFSFPGIGMREWYEYVPTSYTGKKAIPLVVAVHGGGLNGQIYSMYTTWSVVADREGFIVIYPSAPTTVWNAYYKDYGFGGGPSGPDDLKFLKMLIIKVCNDYNIDRGRVYMQGHSMGDIMTSHFAIAYTTMLAAAAPNSGPVHFYWMTDIDGNPIYPSATLPIYRWHEENDNLAIWKQGEIPPANARILVDDMQRQFWIEQNGCDPIPKLCIDGRYNTEVYKCGKVEFRFTEYVGGVHGLNQSAANIIWDDFFSHFARSANGQIITLPPRDPIFKQDKCFDGVAIIVGSQYALVDNNIVEMETAPIEEYAGRMLVPLSFISKAFGAKVKWSADNGQVLVKHQNNTGILTIGVPIIIINNDAITQLVLNPQIVNNIVMVPIRAIAENILKKNVAYSSGAMYISDQEAQIDKYTAHVLGKILN